MLIGDSLSLDTRVNDIRVIAALQANVDTTALFIKTLHRRKFIIVTIVAL